MEGPRMCRTNRRLTHKRSALQHLQVIAELFGAGSSPGRGQHIYRLLGQSVSWNRRVCPGLLARIFPGVVPVLRMVEEIGSKQRDHVRKTAAIVAQIKDDRVRMVYRSHCGSCRGPADGGFRKEIQLQVN